MEGSAAGDDQKYGLGTIGFEYFCDLQILLFTLLGSGHGIVQDRKYREQKYQKCLGLEADADHRINSGRLLLSELP